MRPHIIVHILQSIDGRIAGKFFSQAYDLVGEYAAIREELDADCIIYGATTAAQVLSGVHAGRPTQVRRPVPPGDYAVAQDDFYFAVVDPEGTLRFDGPETTRGDMRGHIVQLLREDVNPGYLSYLRGVGVSYVLAGRGSFDAELAAEKLMELFGVQRALLMGGGYADGTFAAADCVDELSLVVAPIAEVASGQPALFETVRGLRADPMAFELAEARRLPASGLWLHYVR
ncbi:MAG: dihydrofolate reductase family protein [Atopobiaceae bacterium]|nr:dihydrofolate reductase family protein [Atopobiaceae bacterium]